MKLTFVLLVFCGVSLGIDCPSGYVIRGNCVPEGVSPLKYYVELPDSTYKYDSKPMQTLKFPGATAYVLNMTSQTWLSEEDFNVTSTAKSVWTHQLTVVIPDDVSKKLNTGWIWITGGHNNNPRPISPTDDEVGVAALLAAETKTVTAVLKQVPNQPVRFAVPIPHRPGKYINGRTEDGIISYTWNHFIYKDPHSPEWLLRMPMTKAVARAMDTITDFARKTAGVSVENFVVGGASKRGWTTWTTGSVEPRCKAIVPVVMDLLKMGVNIDHHYESLGGYTFEFDDYLQAQVVGKAINTPEFAKLAEIVDAYSYFTRPGAPYPSPSFEKLPKLVVGGGNDEFFLPDDNHAWWDELVGEKHLLHIENADHPLSWFPPPGNGSVVFVNALLPFYAAIVNDIPRPSFTWEFFNGGAGIRAGNFTVAPESVVLWQATTTDGFRDWRLFTCRTGEPGKNCTQPDAPPTKGVPGGPEPHPVRYNPSRATEPSPGVFEGTVTPVDGQYTAFFLAAYWSSGHHFTTQVSIIPERRPFPPCSTEEECNRLI